VKRINKVGYLTGLNITGGKLPIIAIGTTKDKNIFYFVQDGNTVKFVNKKTRKGYSYKGKMKKKINILNNNIENHPSNYYELKLIKPILVNPMPSTPNIQGERYTPSSVVRSISPAPRTISPVPRTISPVPRTISPVPRKISPVPRKISPVPRKISPVPRKISPVPRTISPAPRTISPAPRTISSTPVTMYGPSTFTTPVSTLIISPIPPKDYNIYIYLGVALLILFLLIGIYYFFTE
jgi:hypothetical protein